MQTETHDATSVARSGRLAGRTALITGGTQGIGRGIADAYLNEGANVTVTGRSADKGAALLEEFGAPDSLHFLRSDSTDRDQTAAAVVGCVDRFASVDILVNNVGGGTGHFARVHDLPDSAWEDGLVLNLHSAFWSTRAVLPTMLANGRGRIINISSVEGKMATMPAISPYVVAKHTLGGFTKSVAVEYGEHGITCNAICPGLMELPRKRHHGMEASTAAGISDDQFLQGFLDHTSTKRLTTVEEVAAVAVLLASDEAAGITGALWSVDGGMSPW